MQELKLKRKLTFMNPWMDLGGKATWMSISGCDTSNNTLVPWSSRLHVPKSVQTFPSKMDMPLSLLLRKIWNVYPWLVSIVTSVIEGSLTERPNFCSRASLAKQGMYCRNGKT